MRCEQDSVDWVETKVIGEGTALPLQGTRYRVEANLMTGNHANLKETSMEAEWITPIQLAKRWGVSAQQIWRLRKEPDFPVPVKLFGEKSRPRFRIDEVERYEQRRAAQTQRKPIGVAA
jgi:predicted DNA-binding transcriptional regulator AlpA